MKKSQTSPDQRFLESIEKSLEKYLEKGSTSTSTAKLKPLHGRIAKDIQTLFGKNYTVRSQGFGDDKEESVQGKYYPKKVDITVCENGEPVAGYAVKFVMSSYSKNSNNYFENMLGETANIRAKGIPYFHIFILFDEELTEKKLKKYIALSKDNPSDFFHTPDKILIAVICLNNQKSISYSKAISGDKFGGLVILNDYKKFIEDTVDMVKYKPINNHLRLMQDILFGEQFKPQKNKKKKKKK